MNGVFNGDPHPGNIMLLDDGRIGLIDFGQVKRITNLERQYLARLIVALAQEDKPKVCSLMKVFILFFLEFFFFFGI